MQSLRARLAGKPYLKRGSIILAGAAAGFAYYYFIGCTTGTCPITSSPYISTGYGALVGLLLSSDASAKKRQEDTRSES